MSDVTGARPLHAWHAWEIAEAVRRGERRAVEVLDAALERIDTGNPPLNAVVFVDRDGARRAADEVDRRVAVGDDPGPFAGVPLVVKELEPVAGWPWTKASTAFRDRVATSTSTQTERLLVAGAVPVGLSASPELGLLFLTTSRLHGPTRNPWDPSRTPGGSSGGAGAALAAGLVPLVTGSDMGGSIRLPAGWCGTVGVKGTYGRVPRSPGWIGGADLIHYGPLARCVRDAARYLDVTAGPDERDPGSLAAPAVPYERAITETALAGRRIAVLDGLASTPSHPEVAAAVRDAAAALASAADLEVVEGVTLDTPAIEATGASLLLLDADPALADAMPEVIGNLLQTEGAAEIAALAFDSGGLSLDGIAAAVRLRHELNGVLAELFAQVDLLALPTSPVPAPGASGPIPTAVGGVARGPGLAAAFTGIFNYSGHPVVSVPAGIVDGCPVGMQVVARRHEDVLALAAASVYERARPWPLLAPTFA